MNNYGGMYLPSSVSSPTPGFEYHEFSPSVQGRNSANSTSTGLPPEHYDYLSRQINSLQTTVDSLKVATEKSQTFFDQSVLLQRVCLAVIILIPIILAVVAAVIVWVFSTEAALVQHAKWCLGILSLSGVIDLIVVFATCKINVQRIEQIERRLDNMEKNVH